MEAVEVVRGFWAAIAARDWAAMEELLADDVVVDWPASGERIRGRANVVAVNREYPEGWSIRVLRLADVAPDWRRAYVERVAPPPVPPGR